MGQRIARMKGIGYIVWHTRHEVYHVLIGLVWAWFLREAWNEFNTRWIFWAIFGSLLPDVDHVFYIFLYGKGDAYAKKVKKFLFARQWRMLWTFIENSHKHQTNLATHNVYVMGILLAMSFLSSFVEWRFGFILFGAMIIHYLFDITDDLVQLGSLNPNWARWGRKKRGRVSRFL